MKYSWLELLLCDRWQWVRKLSKCFWVKDKRPGYMWVKFTQRELDTFFNGSTEAFFNIEEFTVEDWRVIKEQA